MRRTAGFTLIEVLIALTMLTVVVLAMGAATGRFVHTVAVSDRQAAAHQLAHDRVAAVQLHPNYATIDATFSGTETSFPTLTGFTRTTVVTTVVDTQNNFKRITVTVNGPGLLQPVARTVSVAAP